MHMLIMRWLAVVAFVVAGSWLAAGLRGGGEEEGHAAAVAVEPGMTVAAFAAANALSAEEAVVLFGHQPDPARPLTAYGAPDALAGALARQRALAAEAASKPWRRIALKFALWLLVIVVVTLALRRGRVDARRRLRGYLLAVLVFGVALGGDPSPMGTVKDALVLFGTSGAVFPPRLIAFAVFMAMVIIVNKSVCAWGCQFGVLQDAIFRLGRTADDKSGALRQYKPPFALLNGIRLGFFALMTLAALGLGFDLVALVDPFRIFNPAALGAVAALFILAVLLGSVFVYRPWCHLFCPFGLAGWLGEQASRVRIRVDRARCIDCGACARACPSTVMGAILRGDRLRPDCFACGSCLPVCPTGAVSFRSGGDTQRPEGHGNA